MVNSFVETTVGQGPLAAVANHSGRQMRAEVAALMALDDASRLQEEDPYTDSWAEFVPTRILMQRSRFEVDLNRPRADAVYRTPEDAWGLNLWKQAITPEVVDRSLAVYDEFYQIVEQVFKDKVAQHGAFVAFDLHSYNHRRNGPGTPIADPVANPEVNVGTGTMDRNYWAPVVERFIADLSAFDFLGRRLDVRENVKFVGRQFPQWTHDNFPGSGCVLAVEFKKFFMDEWTGKLDDQQHHAIKAALASTVPGLLESLKSLGARL